MRKTILILLLPFPIGSLFCQQDSLLRSFKFRNVNYRAITIDFGGGGQYANVDYVNGENTGRAGGGNVGAGISILKSTDKVLLIGSANLGLAYNSSRSHDNGNDSKSWNVHLTPGLNVNSKWFSSQWFFEMGVEGSFNMSRLRSSYNNLTNDTKSRTDNLLTEFILGVGHGRLENVTNMQNALWLVKALEQEQRLSHSLSQEDMLGLANRIVKANNTRILDERKRTQYILETVDGYFQQNNIVQNCDIRYFSTLNDILFFAINQSRLSGTEKYIRITPGIATITIHGSESLPLKTSTTESMSRSAGLSAGINRAKPQNLRHQNNYGASLFLNYRDNDAVEKAFVSGVLITELKRNVVIRQVGGKLFFEHAIYPNTRTVVNLSLHGEYGFQNVDSEASNFGAVGLTCGLNYFISYRTRFTCGVGAAFQRNIYSFDYFHSLVLQPDYINLSASAGVQVSL